MEDGTWKKAKEIFGDALELAPEKRAVFPDNICADDKLLRCEVEILLNSFEKAGSDFMEQGQSERWRR